MAHKVSITPIAHINKDGSVAKRKKDYLVRCRSRGKTCIQTRVGSKDAADSLVAEHRNEEFTRHVIANPRDSGHAHKHGYTSGEAAQVVLKPTEKQKVIPVAPRGKRGLRWFNNGNKESK